MNFPTIAMIQEAVATRAGIIPFLADGRALFFVSSDPSYGGPDPAIAKGRVDQGETVVQAAIREGAEELGLRPSNFAGKPFLGWSGSVGGLEATYEMAVYCVQVKDEKAFSKPGHETERTVWYTREEFAKHGRRSHQAMANAAFDKIDARLRK